MVDFYDQTVRVTISEADWDELTKVLWAIRDEIRELKLTMEAKL